MSDQIHHKLYVVREVTRGTTPDTPTLKTVRHTGCTIGLTKEGMKSAEIIPTRELRDFRHGNRQVAGEIPFELSVETYDELLEAVLMGTWADDVLKVGQTRRSHTFIRNFTDQDGGASPFHRYVGCELNKLSLKFVAGKIITGSFGVIGKNVFYQAAEPAGSDIDLATTTLPLNTFTGSMTINGAANTVVTEFSLTLENGLTPNFVLFDDSMALPSNGMADISGELGLFFEDSTFLAAFRDEEYVNIEIMVADADQSLTIALPRVSLTGGQPDVSGGGKVNLKVPFQATFDADDTEASIIITRATL